MIVVGLARRVERMQTQLKSSLPKDQQNRFHAVKCDVSKEDEIKSAFEWIEKHLGGVDVLVNNAGIARQGQILDENNSEILRSVIDVNLMGVAYCTREAFQSMKKRGVNGHILIINSVVGHCIPITPFGSFNIYAPSKHAITAMTEVLRQELNMNKSKTKITSISPGLVMTEAVESLKDQLPPDMPSLSAEDIADAVVYCIQTPPSVQIHEMIIRPTGDTL